MPERKTFIYVIVIISKVKHMKFFVLVVMVMAYSS